MPMLPAVTHTDFAGNVLESELPVVVDFTAAWCPPCRRLSPILKQIADEYAGRLKVVEVDADEEMQLVGQYGVQGMPTVLIFQGGQEIERLIGLRPKSAYCAVLDGVLGQVQM